MVASPSRVDHGAPVYVAGHRGLVGSALVRALRAHGYHNLLLKSHAEFDLLDERAVHAFFEQTRPAYVFLAAAQVGGIGANSDYPAEFIRQNLLIETHVIHGAHAAGVTGLMFFGSSCIYPRDCPQPIREDYLLTGPLEPTNRPYALAKIAGIELCAAYNRQYGHDYLAVMPTNLYGPEDHYDAERSHVIPAMILKMHEAKLKGAPEVILWGSGAPRREFLFSDDLAEACVRLMNRASPIVPVGADWPLVNIGSGTDLTVAALAECVRSVVGFTGRITWDAGRPDGTPRKLLDVSRLATLGWTPKVGLREGIARVYEAFVARRGEHGRV